MESNKTYLFLIKTHDGGWQVATGDGAVLLLDTESGFKSTGMPLVEAGEIFLQSHRHELLRVPTTLND